MTSVLSVQVRSLVWRQVPRRSIELAKSAAQAAGDIREAIRDLPKDCYLDIWYSPEEKVAAVSFGGWTEKDDAERLQKVLGSVVPVVDRNGSGGWVKVATQPPGVLFCKRALGSSTARGIASLGGWTPDLLGFIPGVPSPLSAMLASGALGAGLGYGTGWVAEKLLPEKWKRKRLRRTLAVLGGLMGAAPGMAWGAVNWKEHGPAGLVKGWPLDTPPDRFGAFRRYNDEGVLINKLQSVELSPFVKEAIANPNPFGDWGPGETGAFPPPIDAQKLVQTIYTPPVSRQLSPVIQAATVGLVAGAGHYQTQGRGMPRLVSPLAVGNMAAGMGSGWLSGLLVGKVLGALTGMPASAQERLRNTGLWAGVIANIVPLAFPNR